MDIALLEADLAALSAARSRWIKRPLTDKIRDLDLIIEATARVAPGLVAAAVKAKGLTPGSALEAEEVFAGPVVLAHAARLLRDRLTEIASTGGLRPPKAYARPDGQVVAKVFPQDYAYRLFFPGFRGEIWMDPAVTLAELPDRRAGRILNPDEGGLALVLGAGNVSSIGPLDVIQKLFVEGRVCILKLNPVNDYLGEFIEEIFGHLIRDGFMRAAYGGADVGDHLCHHELVDEIHITGSDQTHDVIVFGPGEEGAARKARGEPRLHKPITSELGNVTPIIIAPGAWRSSDLRLQAENVATQLVNNAGFNCNAAKVLVLSAAWPQRAAFMDALRAVLAMLPQRPAYYPGAEQRYERFTEERARLDVIGVPAEGVLPWTLIPDLDPQDPDELCFQRESFCGVLGITALETSEPAAFLKEAVAFCNERLWGTLGASVIIDPRAAKAHRGALDEAVASLRYGSVVINHWPGVSYGLGVTTWGAFPGHTLEDIQSGIGVVHNTDLFDAPQKSVIYGPFRPKPKPPFFATSVTGLKVAWALLDYERRPSAMRFLRVLFNALRP